MNDVFARVGGWPVEIECKPDMEKSLERIYAWYAGEVLDRPPVRFSRHNAEYEIADSSGKKWPSLKDRWFDAEYQLEKFLAGLRTKKFLAETFPVYWPNLGPNVFAASFGCPYIFGEVTAWAEPVLEELPAVNAMPALDWQCEYVTKLDQLTDMALEQSPGRFLVGYTDIHPGLDWCTALRGTEALLMDLYDDPGAVHALCGSCMKDFFSFYDHFDAKIKNQKQLSITWMNIPSYGKMHIPSCDFSAMISDEQFEEFAMPGLIKECEYMDHNIFHMDGKGVARHLDNILTLPKLQGIQWVQGMGEDLPILQWIPMIKKIQAAGKGVVVDLTLDELESFISEVPAKGIYLCIATGSVEEERAVLKRLERW
ncbi:hypothetical protein [Leadbettera azotonutricia]|uniref:Uroporphyrinogen decarboxylase (URO-D) domain-containing protein n=1 Tax=Leadbettera azotonutricia (strain ATCC BAA-888 / DSM 13862 / ZAS-9) TaxID=545695 RepID=F5Y9K4_LEAAZ|nr:hypothetical protein [Leadbettera azotonutricia]AEF81468.1 hypothetical protein TREAZ_0830 [Leadbettera azotonutricia ZAS-9]